MKGSSVTDSPSNVGVPRLRVGVPLVVYPVALLNSGSGVCCDALSSDWVRHLALFYPLSYRPVPFPLSPFVLAVTVLLV